MSQLNGKKLKLTIFGESHGPVIGGVIEGLPSGMTIDEDALNSYMARRAPGQKGTTPRKEKDIPTFLSGIFNNRTTGMPLAFEIPNSNVRSYDYSQFYNTPRPSHADYPAIVKYGKENVDLRGGGHFSARLTAPICLAGGFALQILNGKNISVRSYFTPPENIPDGDSMGVKVNIKISGVPSGLGEPHFGGVDSRLAAAIFGVPAVKAVEFGLGVGFDKALGSEVNDMYAYDDNGNLTVVTNNNGGICGGITNSADIDLTVTFKPTPSILLPQKTANISQKTNDILKIVGRHDPCVGIRGAVVLEAVIAFVMADLVLE